MSEGIASRTEQRRPAWFIVSIVGLFLMAASLTSACDDELQPTAGTPAPGSLQAPTIAQIPTPISRPTPASTPSAIGRPAVRAGLDDVSSTEERATPSATASDLAQLLNGNRAFAFDLYRTLAAEDGNLFFSPHSISLALAMAYAGARGETERQMADTLHFLLPQERLHASFNTLELQLASSGRTPDGEYAGFRLNIANIVWGQKGYGFLEEFLDVLEENYGAGVRPVDFRGAPEESRLAINDWVAEQTEDRIRDLIPPEVIDQDTRLVLTNAVYFNAL